MNCLDLKYCKVATSYWLDLELFLVFCKFGGSAGINPQTRRTSRNISIFRAANLKKSDQFHETNIATCFVTTFQSGLLTVLCVLLKV